MANPNIVARLPRGMILDSQRRSTGREWGWKALGYYGNLPDGWNGPYKTRGEAVISGLETASPDRGRRGGKEMTMEKTTQVLGPAWAEYDKVRRQALAEYDKVIGQARIEYDKLCELAWIEYHKLYGQAGTNRP